MISSIQFYLEKKLLNLLFKAQLFDMIEELKKK